MSAIKLLVQAHLMSAIFYCFIIQEQIAAEFVYKTPDIDPFFEHDGMENVVMLVGGTGTGKSTLSKFLRKDPTLKIQKNEADDFVFSDGEAKIGNEDNILSKTLFPQVEKESRRGPFLVDCAGFEDTRHPMYDLLASFFTQKVFNKAQNMKIVVVESFERIRLSSDRTSFMRIIKQLANLLQHNVAAFKGSIGLVASKVDSSKPDKELEKSVHVFLNVAITSLMKKKDYAANLSDISEVQSLERQILLVQFLATGDKVAIFRRPISDKQSLWNQPPFIQNFKQIWKLISQNIRYISTTHQQFEVSVAPETVIYIQNKLLAKSGEKLKIIWTKIENSILQEFQSGGEKSESGDLREKLLRIKNATEKYAAPTSKINSILSLSEYFSRSNVNVALVNLVDLEMKKVEYLCSAVGCDLDGFRNQATAMYRMWANIQNYIEENKAVLSEKGRSYKIYVKPPFTSSVSSSENYSEFIMYLAGLNFDTPTFLAASIIKLTLNDQLHLLNRIKTEQRMDQSMGVERTADFVKYTGKYILSSQIQNTESIQGELIIMATQKFFIDRDLTLTDTHLTIMAPIVEVIGAERTLTLKGSKGASFRTCPIYGAKGMDGNPGLSSGQVKLIALDVVNGQALAIISIGGDGSDGQPGGHGKSSSDPEFAFPSPSGFENEILQQIRSQNYEAIWTPMEVRRCGIKEAHLSVFYENGGSAPTNGADGGNGGAAAPPGTVDLLIRNGTGPFSIRQSFGIIGEGALGGNAGQGETNCRETLFHCTAERSCKDISSFNCSVENRFNCGIQFPLALKGEDGTRVLSAGGMQSYKFPTNTRFDILAQEYCRIASLEKDSSVVVEFLKYLLSLPVLGCSRFWRHSEACNCLSDFVRYT